MMITPMSPIEDLCLSARPANVLRFEYPEVTTVWQLAGLDPVELMRCPNFGKKSLAEIEEALACCGLHLKHHQWAAFPISAEPGPWFVFCL